MFLLVVYIIMFIFLIALLVLSVRRKTKRMRVCLLWAEGIFILVALGVCIYYNIHQGPNFANLIYALFSFGAVFVHGVLLLISVIFVRKNSGVILHERPIQGTACGGACGSYICFDTFSQRRSVCDKQRAQRRDSFYANCE